MKLSHLPVPQRRLIDQCQSINFGRITFRTRGGEPDPDQPWHTRRTIKIAGADQGPRPESALLEYELRREQIGMLSALRGVVDGALVMVEVKHGLPFLVEIEQDHATT